MEFQLVRRNESHVPKSHLFERSADVATLSFNRARRLAHAK
jgi:hypothetical protein